MKQQRYIVKTLGCKANLYDSQLIEAELEKNGWVQGAPGDPGLVCIVNSCSVTDDADRQSRKLAARLARENPDARVVMTGCSAEIDPGKMAASTGVSYVIGNRDKHRFVELLDGASANGVLGSALGYTELRSRHPIDREWPEPENVFQVPPTDLATGSHRTRAFLKIQEGCNSFCTYCIIPYGRGPNRSLRIPEAVARVRALVEAGVREVVITGTNVGDYGLDWDTRPRVTELFEAILSKTRLERLRVSSLDPTEIDEPLVRLMEREPRFCPHFHVSLQSPHDRMLKLMKRKYGNAEVRSCLQRIASAKTATRPFVGVDVITGFPGETEEDFLWGAQELAGLPWDRLHVFPYSERDGTPATRLPGSVPQAERVKRAKQLRELSLERLLGTHRGELKSLREAGGYLRGVLLEGSVRGPDRTGQWMSGYTPDYRRVLVRRTAEMQSNQCVDARPWDLLVDREAGDVAFLAE